MRASKKILANELICILFKEKTLLNSEDIDLNYIKKFVVDSRIENIFLEISKDRIIWQEKDLSIKKYIEESGFKRFIKSSENLRCFIRLKELLDSSGIRYLLLKGGVLSTSIYEGLSSRPINDIDIYVSKDSISQVVNLCSQIGLVTDDEISTSKFHLPSLIGFNGLVKFDLHHRIFSKNILDAVLFKESKTYQFSGQRVFGLNEYFMIAHLIEHGSSRGNFDVGIQYLFDLYFLLEKRTLDPNKIVKVCEELALSKELQLTNKLLKEIFNREITKKIPEPEEKVLKASKEIIFGSYIHNKTSMLISKPQNILNMEIGFKSNATIKTFHTDLFFNAKRFCSLMIKYSIEFLKLLFDPKMKKIIQSKYLVQRFFND